MEEVSIIARSPSFNSYFSSRFAEISAKASDQREGFGLEIGVSADNSTNEPPPEQSSENRPQKQGAEEDIKNYTDEDDFEFTFVSRDPDSSPISAGEIFFNGQIRSTYPVFNREVVLAGNYDNNTKPKNGSTLRIPLRKLLIEERDTLSCSSSEADDLEAVPAGTYCVWTPKSVQSKPERCKKSNSTGSSKRWRIRDFLHRSSSDGKETFVFVTPSTASTKTKKRDEKVEKAQVSKEMINSGETMAAGEGSVTAHKNHYARNRTSKESDQRQSHLPFKQDAVGFFTNFNGLSRSLHPF